MSASGIYLRFLEDGGNMLARIQNALRTFGGQIQVSTTDWMSKLNAGEQTRLSWAKVIRSYEAVPEAYKEFFDAQLSNGQVFPYTILAPVFETLGYRISEKLVCSFDREIYILEKSGNGLVVQGYPLADISYVEFSSMLLDSRIKTSGVNNQGVSTSSMIRFNSVTDYLFVPILKKIRLAAVNSKDGVQGLELNKFDHWATLNYKFMNYARHSLLGGEKVIQALFQPEIKTRRFEILGKTYYRTLAPTHACILTDRELIMIREELLQNRKDNYGGIWDYIPLNKIATLAVNQKDDTLLALSIHLRTNEQLEFLFQASMQAEIDQLLEQFEKLIRSSSEIL
jgi:hypothetical protein